MTLTVSPNTACCCCQFWNDDFEDDTLSHWYEETAIGDMSIFLNGYDGVGHVGPYPPESLEWSIEDGVARSEGTNRLSPNENEWAMLSWQSNEFQFEFSTDGELVLGLCWTWAFFRFNIAEGYVAALQTHPNFFGSDVQTKVNHDFGGEGPHHVKWENGHVTINGEHIFAWHSFLDSMPGARPWFAKNGGSYVELDNLVVTTIGDKPACTRELCNYFPISTGCTQIRVVIGSSVNGPAPVECDCTLREGEFFLEKTDEVPSYGIPAVPLIGSCFWMIEGDFGCGFNQLWFIVAAGGVAYLWWGINGVLGIGEGSAMLGPIPTLDVGADPDWVTTYVVAGGDWIYFPNAHGSTCTIDQVTVNAIYE